MLAIKNNLMADGAARHLGTSYDALAQSVERLSSGLRINSAKDDAAGLAVRELIRADVAAYQQGGRNARDAISMLQTAEGGLSMIDDILVRMRELAEQAATDSYSVTQVSIMQSEFDELSAEITRIAENTSFNDNNLLDATTAEAFEIALGGGLEDGQTIKLDKQDMTASTLGVGGQVGIRSGVAVGAVDDTYMTGAANDTIEISFTIDGTTHALVMDVAADTTLEDLVTAINVESRGAVAGWDAAVAHEDSETGQFVLRLEGWEAGAITAFTIDPDKDGDGTNDVKWGSDTVLSGTAVAATHFESVTGSASLTLGAQAAITAVDTAISAKDTFRAKLGYMMNRLEAAAGVVDIQAENLSAAESRVSDVDVATEMAAMTRNQVLSQAGISMLAQANSMPQMALQLLA